MCGIVGYVDRTGAPANEIAVGLQLRCLQHRGPDQESVRVIASDAAGHSTVVFGHTRLRIIDLTNAGAQPMTGESDDVTVVFNGEIFNFQSLRADLQGRGHVFRSRTDTEVIVHGYEEFGVDVIRKLKGMYAVAIWDRASETLVLARDRIGKKPLYYTWAGDKLSFASSITALRTLPWVETSLDESAVAPYLAFGYVPGPGTFFNGIRELPPGHFLATGDGDRAESEPKAFWRPQYSPVGGPLPRLGRLVDETWEFFKDSVERRLVADVPLGLLLSGGVDSGLVLAAATQLGASMRTFTAGVMGGAGFDERPAARSVAAYFDADHHETLITGSVAELLQRLLWFTDQPFADSSIIPTYLVARAAREHVTVVLNGDGADEIFGGYERFAAAVAADRVPRWAQRFAASAADRRPRSGSYFDTASRAERFIRSVDQPPISRYRGWVTLFSSEQLSALLGEHVDDGATTSFDVASREFEDLPLLHRLLGINLTTYLPGDLLVKMDRMTMANSLEARSPYLDVDLVDFVNSLPTTAKVHGFEVKRLLRQVAERQLPRQTAHRRKHGFGVPVATWLRSDLRGLFRETVLASDAFSSAFLRSDAVSNLFEEHQAGADHGPGLWAILCLELWGRAYGGMAVDHPPAEAGVSIH